MNGRYDATDELKNFLRIVSGIAPTKESVPHMSNIDIYGESVPLRGEAGGDHIAYLDFKRDCDLAARSKEARTHGRNDVADTLENNYERAGILLADVSGHNMTDAAVAVALHSVFLAGVEYELDRHGEVTTDLFEKINEVLYRVLSGNKFLTMIYGEIAENGRFRFLSAAHPPPVVYSNKYDRIVDIGADRLVTFPPIGTMPSEVHIDKRRRRRSALGYKERYTANEINLMGSGDILLIHTDGLSDHKGPWSFDSSEAHVGGEIDFFPRHLEDGLRRAKDRSAKDIYNEIKDKVLAFGPLEDDVSYVVIKKK